MAAAAIGDGKGGGVRTMPLVAPSVVLLLIFSLVPLALTIFYSLYRYNLLYPERYGFYGLRNYFYLFQNPNLWIALRVTLQLVVEVLALTLIVGTVTAALFETRFAGRGFARVLMISPFFVMPTVAAVVWKNLFMSPVNGIFAWIAGLFGLGPIDMLGHWPLTSVVMIVAWEWTPFAFLILVTALQSLDDSVLEAAKIDGAGPIAVFFNIQLPHLGRAIGVVTMIETIFLLSIFAEIAITTSGGPGVSSSNLTFLISQRLANANDVGGASAMGVVAIILANVVAAILIRIVAKRLDV